MLQPDKEMLQSVQNLLQSVAAPMSLGAGEVKLILFCQSLKVPKREIFDRSDFPDFYTIKSLCVGDFGVKIKNLLNNN